MRVLLAIDESESAALAAQLVRHVAWPPGSVIRVLAVVEPAYDPAAGMPGLAMSPDILQRVIELVRAEAERLVMATSELIANEGRLVEQVVSQGRPATVIVDAARAFRADLVVVGSRGRGPVAGALLGSVSVEVAESAPCSVLVVRRDTISRLVLADDRSENAESARHLVATMPGFHGLSVHVVGVKERAPNWYTWLAQESGPEIQAFEDAWAKDQGELTAFINREAKALADAGIVATAHLRDGDPASEIVAFAHEHDADLIVMGSHGRSRLTAIALGSISRKVLAHTPCSVLIVRARQG
jgi:nucleotide-binding universal stress UspA family protein